MSSALHCLGRPVRGQLFHFLGVGGIGMSGLAEVLANAGAVVSGSDSGGKPESLQRLEKAGVTVYRNHAEAVIPPAAIVVVSSAITPENTALKTAQAQGNTLLHRADLLAAIMQNYRTIAVSGTHGKTSTTAFIFSVLQAAGVPCGVINGGVMHSLGTTAILPKGPKGWLVVEADESDASFLKLKPTIAVITNIEPEHMETYGTEAKLLEAFAQFAANAEMAVLCIDDPNTAIIAGRVATDVITYGADETADSVLHESLPQSGGMVLECTLRGGRLDEIELTLPGAHYALNALAALTVAQAVGADVLKAANGLKTFAGVARRFSKVGTFHGATIIDDYGHHPTEIATTIEAAKLTTRGRVIAVIQPHRFTRLRDLMADFATCAKVADAAILLPVYSAGEGVIAGITHLALAEKMDAHGHPAQIIAVNDEAGLTEALHSLHPTAADTILCLGAGSITDYAKRLASHTGHGHGG